MSARNDKKPTRQLMKPMLMALTIISLTHSAAFAYLLHVSKVPVVFRSDEVGKLAKAAVDYADRHHDDAAALDTFAQAASHNGLAIKFDRAPQVDQSSELSAPMAELQNELATTSGQVRISESRRALADQPAFTTVSATPRPQDMLPVPVEGKMPLPPAVMIPDKVGIVGKADLPFIPLIETMNATISIEVRPGLWANLELSGEIQRISSGALAAVFIFSSAILLALIFWQINPLVRGIGNLRVAFNEFGKGDTLVLVPEGQVGQLRELEQAFNSFSRQEQKSRSDQTAVLNAIAHDLLTPIASLKIRSEFVGHAKLQAEMCRTLDEMRDLTHSVLDAARGGAIDEDERIVDLTSMIEAIVDDYADLGKDVTAGPLLNVQREGKPSELKRMLRNLIDNALQYAGSAMVSIEVQDRDVTILVEDNGKGIPEGQLQAMLKPFARVEKSRNRETGGFGLGLSIADAIATRHGGVLSLENRAMGGLRVRVRFSQAQPARR